MVGSSRYIGRVGALAVALGIGSAVVAGPAWAEPAETDSTSSSTVDSRSPAPDSPGDATRDEPDSTSSAAPQPGSTVSETTESAADPDDAAAKPRRVPKRKPPRKAPTEASAPLDPPKPAALPERTADLTPRRPEPEAKPKPTAPPVALAAAQTVTPAPDPLPQIAASTGAEENVAVAISAAGPSATPGSDVPVTSPAEWVLLAAARREIGSGTSDTATATGQTSTSQPLAAAATNAPPVIIDPTLVTNPESGVVTGKINATDPEKKKLTYALAGDPPAGLAFNAKTATFTYTPTTAQRILAGLSSTPVTVSFTVTVTDGLNPVNTTVAVAVPAIPITDAGVIHTDKTGIGVVASNTRAYVRNTDNTITVIDTVNRTVVDTITLDSPAMGVALTPDGKRLYVSTVDTQGITVINTATNAISSVLALGGRWADLLTVSPDGKTLYALTSDERSGDPIATVTKIAVSTGKVTGAVTLPGAAVWYDESGDITTFYGLVVTPDSKKIYVIADLDSDDEQVPSGLFSLTSTGKTAHLVRTGSYFTEAAVSPDGKRLYVNDVDGEKVLILDTATDLAVGEFDNPGGWLGSLVLTGDGSVLVMVDTDLDTVVVYDTRTTNPVPLLTVATTVNSADGWPGITVSPDGKELTYVADDGAVQVISLMPTGATRAIGTPVIGTANPVTGAVSGSITASIPGRKLTYTLVSGPGQGTLTLNKATGAFTFTPTAAQRVLAGFDPDATTSFTVTVADGKTTLPVTVTISVDPVTITGAGSFPVGVNTWGITVTNNRAYVSNWETGTITVIDTVTGTLLDPIDIGAPTAGLAVTPDGKRLFVASYTDNTVVVIDTATNTVSRTISLPGKQPVSVAVSPDGKTVYVGSLAVDAAGQPAVDALGNLIGGAVSKISTSNYKVTGTVTNLGYVPTSITVAPNGKKIYVISTNSNNASAASSTQLYAFASGATKGTRITGVGDEPRAVAINAAGTIVFVAGSDSGVYALETQRYTPVWAVDIGVKAGALLLNRDGTLLLAKTDGGTFTTLDATTLTPLGVFTPDTPYSYATPGLLLSPDGMQAYTIIGDQLQILSLLPPNAFPVTGDPTINAPSPTGVVTGRLTISDTDGDTLTLTASKPAHGTLTLGADGSFVYTPTAAARHAAAGTGPTTDTFTVTVDDGRRGITTRTVTLDIPPANADPTAKKTVGKPNSTTGTVAGSVTGTDKDKDALTYIVSTPTRGTVSITAKGAYTYTPTPQARHDAAAGGPTTDTFTVTIDDGHGGVVDVDVQVPISPKNATPADPVLQLRAPDGIGTITFGVR